MDFETRAIHAGQEPDPATGAVITPIYQTSTYVQEEVGKNKGYDYSRVANPTRTALESALASLEGAEHGLAFSSGLGATTTIMHLVDPGERVVLIADVYGGVYRMTSKVYEPKGYSFTYVPADEFDDNLASHLGDDVRARLGGDAVEPAPQHRRHPARRRRRAHSGRDSRRRQHIRHAVPPAAARARRRPRRALDDEVPRRPLRRDRRLRRARTTPRSPSVCASCRSRSARCPGPFDCWLVLRGIKTLAVRMRQHCDNARADRGVPRRACRGRARHLSRAPGHPGHAVARTQMRDFGGMVSFLARVGGGGGRVLRAHEALPARRVARRRREPDRASGAHDACLDRGRAVRRAAQPRAPVGRDRVGRRPRRRSRGGARQIWIACDRVSSPKRTRAPGSRLDQPHLGRVPPPPAEHLDRRVRIPASDRVRRARPSRRPDRRSRGRACSSRAGAARLRAQSAARRCRGCAQRRRGIGRAACRRSPTARAAAAGGRREARRSPSSGAPCPSRIEGGGAGEQMRMARERGGASPGRPSSRRSRRSDAGRRRPAAPATIAGMRARSAIWPGSPHE